MSDQPARRPDWSSSHNAILWGGISLMLIALALFLALPSRTRAKSDRIVKGLTEKQVEEIMGCPPGFYDLTRRCGDDKYIWSNSDEANFRYWYFSDCILEVRFDREFRVHSKILKLPPPNLYQKAKQWIADSLDVIR